MRSDTAASAHRRAVERRRQRTARDTATTTPAAPSSTNNRVLPSVPTATTSRSRRGVATGSSPSTAAAAALGSSNVTGSSSTSAINTEASSSRPPAVPSSISTSSSALQTATAAAAKQPASPYRDDDLSRKNDLIAQQAASALASARKSAKPSTTTTTTTTTAAAKNPSTGFMERRLFPSSTSAPSATAEVRGNKNPIATTITMQPHRSLPKDPPAAPKTQQQKEVVAPTKLSTSSTTKISQQKQPAIITKARDNAGVETSSYSSASTRPTATARVPPQYAITGLSKAVIASTDKKSDTSTTSRPKEAATRSVISSLPQSSQQQQQQRLTQRLGENRKAGTGTTSATSRLDATTAASRTNNYAANASTTSSRGLPDTTSAERSKSGSVAASKTSSGGTSSAASRLRNTSTSAAAAAARIRGATIDRVGTQDSQNQNTINASSSIASHQRRRSDDSSSKSIPVEEEEELQQQDVVTIEEMEESIVASSPERPFDAACILHSSMIQLRNRQDRVFCARDIQEEGFSKVMDTTQACTDEAMLVRLGSWQLVSAIGKNNGEGSVRYGDNILIALPDKKRLLGVSTNSFRVCTLPFFTSDGTLKASSWTVLRALPNNQKAFVRVGRSAVERSRRKKQTRSKNPAKVFSGDAILLRHCLTGFLLSIHSTEGEDARVGLVMDSYNSRIPKEGCNTELVDRLEDHDVYLPSDHEILHLTLATAPPSTPLWIASTTDKRSFLEGDYLSAASRRNRELLPEGALFDSPSSSSLRDTPGGQIAESSRRKQLQDPIGQELALCDELTASFMGLEGRFVKASQLENGRIHFDLEQGEVTFDPSLSSLVNAMLPLSTAYVQVRHFVSSRQPGYEYGSVAQALCEQLDVFLLEYTSAFVKGLDVQYRQQQDSGIAPSLTHLLVHVRPTMHRMVVLQQVVDAARCEKGGALLNSLRILKQRLEGDAEAADIIGRLLGVAAVPFMIMISRWMQCGILSDPYKEFMIQKNEDKDCLWENSYTLRDSHILAGCCSSKQTVELVLATGRYWNAIHACQDLMRQSNNTPTSDSSDDFPVLPYDTNATTMAACVKKFHCKASKLLVRLLLDNFALVDSLRLMKRYFLLDHGDFFVNFMDVAEHELLKDITRVSQGRTQHWLNTAVLLAEHRDLGIPPSSPSGGEDSTAGSCNVPPLSPSKLQSRFEPESLIDYLDGFHAISGGIDTHEAPTPSRHAYGEMEPDSLTGLEAFVVDFSPVPFPTSLVLSPPAMEKYQLLFRHLFYAKYVERRLVDVWQGHQAFRELQSLRGALGSTFLLRQRMLHFLQNLIYYMMVEVIEPNWLDLEKSIEMPSQQQESDGDQTLDDIIHLHTNFLSKTLEACLLTNCDLLRSLTKLMSTCLLFTDQMRQFMKATKIEDDRQQFAIKKRGAVQRNLYNLGVSRRESHTRRLMEDNIRNDMAERKERIKKQTARVRREVSSESYQRMIARFDQVFSEHLSDFMLQLKRSDAIVSDKVNLCIRLDYNGYLSNALGLASSSTSSRYQSAMSSS